MQQIRELEDKPERVSLDMSIGENAHSRWARQRESELLEAANELISENDARMQVLKKDVSKITKTSFNAAEKKAIAYIKKTHPEF